MSKQQGSIGNLIQGVSQQDPKIRADGQVQEQLNMRSHVTLGAVTRPGTKFECEIPSGITIDQDTFIYDFSADGEEYVAFIRPDGIAIIDYAGNYQAISGGYDTYTAEFKDPALSATYSLSDYVGTAADASDIKAYTLADTTFILNKKAVPSLKATSPYGLYSYSFIYVKAVTFGMDYSVYVDVSGTATSVASVSIPSAKTVASGDVNLQTVPSTRDVACFLLDQICAAGYNAFLIGDCVVAVTGQDITVESGLTEDIVAFSNSIPKYEDLPLIGSTNQDIKVIGDETAKDEYYVIGSGTISVKSGLTYTNPETGSTTLSTGLDQYMYADFRWDEVASDEQDNGIDAETMPHLITKTSSGFLVSRATWESRPAGDAETNPNPKFIGVPITSIGEYQNRLTFTSGKYLCSSRTDEWFAFWKDTVISDNPANPCYLAAVPDKDSDDSLNSFSELAGDLLVFSDHAQYRVFGDSPYTASSPLVKVGSTNMASAVPPASLSTSLLLAYSSGSFTNVKQLVVAGDSRILVPLDVSGHCPYYIEDYPAQVIAHPAQGISFIRTVDGFAPSRALWVYETGRNSLGEQIQQAWHKWVFGNPDAPDHIRHMWIKDNYLYMVMLYVDIPRYVICSLPLDPAKTEFLAFRPILDRMEEVTTEVGNFYEADITAGNDIMCILTGDNSGVRLLATAASDRLIIDPSEYLDDQVTVVVGRPYKSSIILSTLFLRGYQNVARTTNRTQLKRMWLDYSRTGHIEVRVTDRAGTTTTKTWDTTEDAMNSSWDEIALQSGTLMVPLRGTNTDVTIEILSEDYLPFGVSSFQFTARYGKKSNARAKNRIV